MAVPKMSVPPVLTGAAADGPAEVLDVIETPTSPSSGLALSRFEFQTGKANEGTKILMVDWDLSASGSLDDAGLKSDQAASDWEVSWQGKTTVLPARETADASVQGLDGGLADGSNTRRVYFLLPPGAPMPPLVTISRGSKGAAGWVELRTKPMPAIFHPDLGVDKRDVGARGVLHTIWAKKRLSELQAEIDQEMKANSESIGLEMALQEKRWIAEEFGLPGIATTRSSPPPLSPASPTSPRGKLGEKLKGLKLATSPTELAAATQAARLAQISSLSPQAADVAVSSFAAFHRNGAGAGKPAGSSGGGIASLSAVLGGGGGTAPPAKDTGDTEEDLFALPMSPRSPEMKRSPFSLL